MKILFKDLKDILVAGTDTNIELVLKRYNKDNLRIENIGVVITTYHNLKLENLYDNYYATTISYIDDGTIRIYLLEY